LLAGHCIHVSTIVHSVAPILEVGMWNQEDLPAYEIIYSGVKERPEGLDIFLKRTVAASGFEPPTSGPEPDPEPC
jgi:hypothetical protein